MVIRKAVAGTAIALTAMTGGFVTSAEAASAAENSALAASCPNVTPTVGTVVVTQQVIKDQAAVHNGPAAKCTVTGHLARYTPINLYCTYYNAATGNYWDFTDYGWIYDAYVSGNGAAYWC